MRDGRVLIGFVLFHLVLAAPGAALLYTLGLLRPRPLALALAAGPAFLLGAVVIALPVIVMLVLGVTVSSVVGLGLVAGLTVTFVAVGKRRVGSVSPLLPGAAGTEPLPGVERVMWPALAGVLAVAAALTALALAHAPTAWDDANIWSLKGLTLYEHGRLVPGVFRNPDFSFVHLDYPVLQPMLQASFLRAIGGVDTRLWHVELSILFSATIWTLGWLLTAYGRRWLWIVPLAVGGLSPLVFTDVTLGNADVFMAGLLACGAVSVGLCLDEGRWAYSVLGAILLGGAANVKNEGLAFAVCVLLAAAAVVLVARLRERRRPGLLMVGIVIACALPWQLWLLSNPFAANLTPAPWKAVQDPASLIDRLDLLWRGVEQIALQLASTPTWQMTVPAFIVLAGVLFKAKIARPLVSFYLLAWFLGVLVIAYTYWATPVFDLSGFETRTGPRIVSGVVFIALGGLAHLLQVAARAAETSQQDVAEPESEAAAWS